MERLFKGATYIQLLKDKIQSKFKNDSEKIRQLSSKRSKSKSKEGNVSDGYNIF